MIYDNNFNHNILCYHYHSGAFAWGDARVVLWNACMLVVVGRPLKRWDMEPLVKIILTMTGIHVCFNCISIGLNVEFLIVKDCHCYERLREYLQVVIIAAVILNTLVMCIGIGFFVTHISKCPSTNLNFLQFPLPQSPPPTKTTSNSTKRIFPCSPAWHEQRSCCEYIPRRMQTKEITTTNTPPWGPYPIPEKSVGTSLWRCWAILHQFDTI